MEKNTTLRQEKKERIQLPHTWKRHCVSQGGAIWRRYSIPCRVDISLTSVRSRAKPLPCDSSLKMTGVYGGIALAIAFWCCVLQCLKSECTVWGGDDNHSGSGYRAQSDL